MNKLRVLRPRFGPIPCPIGLGLRTQCRRFPAFDCCRPIGDVGYVRPIQHASDLPTANFSMTIVSGSPARSKFRTALGLRSCNVSPSYRGSCLLPATSILRLNPHPTQASLLAFGLRQHHHQAARARANVSQLLWRALPAVTPRPGSQFGIDWAVRETGRMHLRVQFHRKKLAGTRGSPHRGNPSTTELFNSCALNSVGVCLLCEVRFRRRARRIKPSADIDPGVGLPTEVTRSRGARRHGIPFEDGKFGSGALDHKPVTGAAGNPTADFAPEFLKGGHSCCIFPLCSSERCSLASLIIWIPAALLPWRDRRSR
jgi:hypothetical protein